MSASAIPIPPPIRSIVGPENGSLYAVNYNEVCENIFKYNIELGNNKDIQQKGPIVVNLWVKNAELNKWIKMSENELYYPHQKWFNTTLDLTNLATNLSENESILRKLNYRVLSPSINSVIFEGSGPDIWANFRNERFEQKNNKYNYSVRITSSKSNLRVYLLTRNTSDDSWVLPNLLDYRVYNSTKKWTTLFWKDKPHYDEVKFIPSFDLKHENYSIISKTKGPELWIGGSVEVLGRVKNITFINSQKEEASALKYTINVINFGDEDIENLEIAIKLSPGIKPINKEIQDYRADSSTEWIEHIDTLRPEANNKIKIQAYMRNTVADPARAILVNARGYRFDSSVVPLSNEFKVKTMPITIS